MSLGQMIVRGETFDIDTVRLYLPEDEQGRLMYLWIGTSRDSGFAVWGALLQLADKPADLHGKRLHVRLNGYTYDDDTLGTDVIGIEDTTDLNYVRAGDEAYAYDEIQIDFERVSENEFRCRLRGTLTTEEDDEASDDPVGSIPWHAEFLATPKEIHPDDEADVA